MGDMFYPGQKDYIKKLNQLASSGGGAGASLSIGTVEEGDTAAASITGTAPDQKLNLTLPKGDKGDKGDAGDEGAKGDKGDKGDAGEQGPAGVTPRGAWSADAVYAVNDLATYAGSAWRRIVAGSTPATPDVDTVNWEIFVHAGTDGSGGGGGSGTVSVTAPLTSTGGSNPTLGINAATESASGSMSAADKTKLDGVATGAAAVGNVVGAALGGASAGTAATAARSDHVHPLPTAANVGAVAASAVGAANGVAPLDSTGKVAAAYLPSYVDDVLEYANLAAFPATGEAGKIYVADDSNLTYRWSGSTYIEISASPGSTDAVPEGATNQYFTVGRVLGAILTGFSTASSAAVAATDSILTAIGKLQAQITGKAAVGSTAGAALAAAGAVGSATTAARSDHVHPFPSAANVGAVATTSVGVANGVASLGSDGLVPTSQLPAMSGAQTGDILYTARTPASGYLKADGSVYLQSAYPALFGVLGVTTYAWTNRTASFADSAIGIASNGSLLVALGANASIATSADGVTWTTQTALTGYMSNASSIWYGNGLFIVTGYTSSNGAALVTSPDGVTWTSRTLSGQTTAGSRLVQGIYGFNGKHVVAGLLGSDTSWRPYTSTDGITWTRATTGTFLTAAVTPSGFACSTSIFVALGYNGSSSALSTSPDAVTWTIRSTPLSTVGLSGVVYANGLFIAWVNVASSSLTALQTSPDGITWTARTAPFTQIAGVAYGNGQFVMVSGNGTYATSQDGITWTTSSQALSFSPTSGNAVSYALKQFVMFSSATGGQLATLSMPINPATQFQLPSLPSYGSAAPYIKT